MNEEKAKKAFQKWWTQSEPPYSAYSGKEKANQCLKEIEGE